MHCNAAAKVRAATDLPEPGGPVNNQACVIEPGSSVAPDTSAAADLAAVADWVAGPRDRPMLVDAKVTRERGAWWLEEAFRGH